MSAAFSLNTHPINPARRPSLPSALESPRNPSQAKFRDSLFPTSATSGSLTASYAMARKLSLDDAVSTRDALAPTASIPMSPGASPQGVEHHLLPATLLPQTLPSAFNHAFAASAKDAASNGFSSFKSLLFAREADSEAAATYVVPSNETMDWDLSDAQATHSMMSSASSSSFQSSIADSATASTINTTFSAGQIANLPMSSSLFTGLDGKSTSSAPVADEMDEDAVLQSPGFLPMQQSQPFSSSWSISQNVTATSQTSIDPQRRGSEAPMPDSMAAPTVRAGSSLGQSLGLILGESPRQNSILSSGDILPRLPPPSLSSKKRTSLALSPLKIAPGSAFLRPNQPTTPGGSIVPFARDGAATGDLRSPFEPPTPLRSMMSGADGFPFTSPSVVSQRSASLERLPSPLSASVALMSRSSKNARTGSLSPMTADFAASVSLGTTVSPVPTVGKIAND